MAENTLGRNQVFAIKNADGTPFHDLVLHKATYDSVVMSLGDKITGDVYYKDNRLDVTMSEYIIYKGVRYTLVNPPTILREGLVSDNSELRGMTKYSFTFYHPMYMLGNFPFSDVAVSNEQKKYLSQNKSFSWIGNLTDFVAKINKNLEGTEWVCEIGSTVSQDIKSKLSDVLTFDNQMIAAALKTEYDTWKVPYVTDTIANTDARYSQGKRFLIHFGLPSQEILGANNSPFVFQFGKGVGLKNNSRSPKNNKIITRIAGYGSENNIPYGYPQIVWTGNQDWGYTVNNSSSATNSYPIYDGIVNGQRVRLIKHPFTRNHLMPSVYVDTVNKKVNPNADGYDPTIEIKDYYDAVSSGSYTYPNPINQNAPSYEIHEFENIKPELGQSSIVGVSAYNQELDNAITLSDCLTILRGYYTESTNEIEKEQLNNLINALPTAVQTGSTATIDTYSYDWLLTSDAYYAYVRYTSSILNFKYVVLRAQQVPVPTWNDDMDDDGNYVQSYFKITLPQLSFDLYACAAITEEMSINMRSGACIGCTFPIQVDWDDYKKNFYDEEGNFDPVIGTGHPRNASKYPNSSQGQITVVVQKDLNTFGTLMPNVYQMPNTNDKFVILGISLPLSYVTSAQERLDAEMVQYMKDNNVYYFDYPLKFDEHFLATHTSILSQMKCNTIIRFNYNGTTIPLYIKQMTVKYGQSPLPQYDITLTDDVDIVLNQIGRAVETVRAMVQGNGVDIDQIVSILDERYDARYLSKQYDDTANGFINMIRGLQVGERFVSGLLGQGAVFRTDNDGKTYLEVDKMYVRMRAYFDTVEIKRYLHSNGNRIASSAGIKCSRVEYITSGGFVTQDASLAEKFRCYFRINDNGNTSTNDFVVGDLAFCKESNAQVSSGVSQHGYWRAVVSKNSSITADGEGWIDLSASDCLEGSGIPIAQDDIIQLGNKEDTTRQGAIIEYVSGDDAPSYQIYQNINDYSLENKNYISMGYSSSTGRAYMNVAGDFRFGAQTDSLGSYIKYNQQTHKMEIKADVKFTSPYTQQETDLDAFAAAIKAETDYLQSQLDGQIDTWFYDGVPTLSNTPAVDWYDGTQTPPYDVRNEHIGDLYYDKLTGYGYRFIYDDDNETYSWIQLSDDAVSEALRIANDAKDTADGKRRVFLTTPTPPYDEGDLWVNAVYPANYTGNTDASQNKYNNDLLRCSTQKADGELFSISDWQLASKYTDDSSLNAFVSGAYAQFVQNIQGQVDGKAETWYQDNDPSSVWYQPSAQPPVDVRASHVGDIWCDTSQNGGKKTYIYKDYGVGASPRYAWAEQAVPTAVFDTIDGKCAIYISWGAWDVTANGVTTRVLQLKDLFIPSTDTTQGGVTYKANKVYRCTVVGTPPNNPTFTEISYTDDTRISNFINEILNGSGASGNDKTVADAIRAVNVALGADTQIIGGLILSTMISLKSNGTTWAGISGVFDSQANGNGIAAWYGGGMVDYEALSDAQKTQGWSQWKWARTLFRMDGSGYVANGNISWNADGTPSIKGNVVDVTTLKIDGATINFANYVTINTAQTITGIKTFGTTDGSYIQIGGIRLVYDQPNNALKIVGSDGSTSASIYATGSVSALGISSNGGGGGSSTLAELLDVSIDNPTEGQALVYNYATSKWVNANVQGLDQNALSQYLSTKILTIKSGLTTLGTWAPTAAGEIDIANVLIKASSNTLGCIKVGSTLEIDSSTGVLNLKSNTATANTYPKISYNQYGLVTGGSNLSPTDIPSLDWSKISSGKPTTISGYGITDAVSTSTTWWGRGLDANGNVSGAISNTWNITPSASGTYNIGSSTNYYSYIYTQHIDTASNVNLKLCAGGTERILVDATSGYVGIGLASPNHRLHVNGQSYITHTTGNVLLVNSTGNYSVIQFLINDTRKWSVGADANKFYWYSSDTMMSLTNGGDLGIGTQVPYTKLDVNGGVKTTRIYLSKPNQNNDTNAVYFEYDSANGGIHLVGAGFYSDSYISSLGLNAGSGNIDYLPLTAGSLSPLSGSLYFDAYGNGVYLKDSGGNTYAALINNAESLWIGANATAGTHHTGGTYISSGTDNVYISRMLNGVRTNFKVLDAGNTSISGQVITINGSSITVPTGSGVTVVDNLTTQSTTSALSANQGYVLNNKFSNYQPKLTAYDAATNTSLGEFSNIYVYGSVSSGNLTLNYLPLSGGTVTGNVTLKSNAELMIKMNDSASNMEGISWIEAGTSTARAAVLYYYNNNNDKRIIMNASGASNYWIDTNTKYSLVLGNGTLTFNTYEILNANHLNTSGMTLTGITVGGTTYSISASGSYIPLSGSSAITGSLIPNTTNSYDIGSSSKSWKNIYCKKIGDTATDWEISANDLTITGDNSVSIITDSLTWGGNTLATQSWANSQFLKLNGGTMSGQILRSAGGWWIEARDNAVVRNTKSGDDSFNPVCSSKSKDGEWSIGVLGTGNTLAAIYTTDADYNANPKNNNSVNVYFPKTGGTLALTSDFNNYQTKLTAYNSSSTSLGNFSNIIVNGSISSGYLTLNYLPLSGGTLTGNLNVNANVGIGDLASSSYKLYVNGSSYYSGVATFASGVSITGDVSIINQIARNHNSYTSFQFANARNSAIIKGYSSSTVKKDSYIPAFSIVTVDGDWSMGLLTKASTGYDNGFWLVHSDGSNADVKIGFPKTSGTLALLSDIGSGITVVDGLTSTSTTDALSANQGRVLNNKFSNYQPKLTVYLSGGGTSEFSGISVNGTVSSGVLSLNYLPLSGGTVTGNITMSNAKIILDGKGIEGTGEAGMLVYKPSSGWNGISSSQWGVGAVNCQGVIRSSATDLVHYRGSTSYTILDSYNVLSYAKEKYRVQKSGCSSGWRTIAYVSNYGSMLLSVSGGWNNSACSLATFYITHHNATDRIIQIGTGYKGFVTDVRLRRPTDGSIYIDIYVSGSTTSVICAEIISLDSRPTITMYEFTEASSSSSVVASASVCAFYGTFTGSLYTSSGGVESPSFFGKGNVGALMSNYTVNGDTTFKNWIYMDSYTGTDAGGTVAIGVSRTNGKVFALQSASARSTWNIESELIRCEDGITKFPLKNKLVTLKGDTTAGDTTFKISAYIIKLDAYTIENANGNAITSDVRLKNIVSYKNNIDVHQISNAPVFDFIWKNTGDTRMHLGTSAQYWQSILPSAVINRSDGYLAIDYGAIALVSSVLTARKVVDHEQRIMQLEEENEKLKAELETLKNA